MYSLKKELFTINETQEANKRKEEGKELMRGVGRKYPNLLRKKYLKILSLSAEILLYYTILF